MKKLFKMKWVIMAMCITALMFTVGACGKDEVGTSVDTSGIDWTDYKDFSIRVSNNTKKDLVAFQSSLTTANMLGGIYAQTTNHGLFNDPAKFGSSPKQFKMIFITKEQYEANKDTLSLLNNDYFTQMFVYWNGQAGDNAKVYEISSKLGGEYQLIVQNDSSTFDVELRTDGPSGPILGFAPSGMVTNKLNVSMGDISVFPVFKFFNATREVIETIYPKRTNGTAWRMGYNFEPGVGPQQLNLKDALKLISGRSSGVAYLRIYNNCTGGAISFLKGNSIQVNALGFRTWNNGQSKEFVIEMPTAGSGDNVTFGSEIQISNWGVDCVGDRVNIKTVENGSETFTVLADKMYTVYVTGDPGEIEGTAGYLKALIELREEELNGPTAVTFGSLFTN